MFNFDPNIGKDVNALVTSIDQQIDQIASVYGIKAEQVREAVFSGLAAVFVMGQVRAQSFPHSDTVDFVCGKSWAQLNSTGIYSKAPEGCLAAKFDEYLCLIAATALRNKRSAEVSRG